MRKGLGILGMALLALSSVAPLCDSASGSRASCSMRLCESAGLRSSEADGCCCAGATQPAAPDNASLKIVAAAPFAIDALAWHAAADRTPTLASPTPRHESRPLHLLHAALLI